MSHEIHRLRQCSYCLAYFASNDLLYDHIQEYQSRAAELEKCQAHANANCDEDSEHVLGNGSEKLDTIKKNTRCPYPGCSRTEPFKTGQQLRVHFRIHVPCEEVCVCCFKVFRQASEYIRHAREHTNASETKRRYTTQICDELHKLVNRKLQEYLAEVGKTWAKKRTWEEAALDPEMGACDAKLDGADMMTSSCYLPINGINSLNRFGSANTEQVTPTVVPLPETAPASVSLSEVAGPVNTSSFAIIQTQSQLGILDDEAYDPPSTHLNFPQRWMQEVVL